jgi:hypothetical protein
VCTHSRIAAVGVVTACVFVSVASAAGARLTGVVGPGAVISFQRDSGVAIKSLRRGTYTIVVRDRSGRQNFHLYGPTAPSLRRPINLKTQIPFVGRQTWIVHLRPGTYRYYSDGREPSLKGSFRVT